jgi:hypothetical protein
MIEDKDKKKKIRKFALIEALNTNQTQRIKITPWKSG